ncbi:MAG: tetratricopeptide repeat protein [Thiobacillus sp.]|jgi:predicted O-linked N-acetylglucosamine transferase (SPINDLY family)|nr:tetratricopeptide repeat protein [Thiobacillus sp.]
MTPNVTQLQPVSQATDQLLQQAIAHHQSGRLQEAGVLYQTILQHQPSHPEANHNLGVIAIQAQQPAAGLPYFMAALDADPTCGQYWLNYIDALFQAGQQEDARAVLALARQQGLQGEEVDALAAHLNGNAPVAVQRDLAPWDGEESHPVSLAGPLPGNTPGHQEMDVIVALFGEGRYAEVATLAQRLTVHYPLHEFGWKILGVALKLLGRGQDALEPMRKAAMLLPTDVESHYNLGVTLQELGRMEEAEASYLRVLQIDPVYADAYLNLGVTLRTLGRLDEAEERLRQALQIRPDYAEAHGNLGTMLQERGCLDEAEASFRKALQLTPDHAVLHDNLGVTLYRLGRLEEAEGSFRQALRINPDNARTHNDLGVTLQELGRLDEADAHFQMALLINPDDARTHDNRGNLLCYLGRQNEAAASYRRALEITPDDAGMHANLGRCFRNLRHWKDAESHFRKSLEINPDDLETHNNLGLTLQDLGLLDKAEACFRDILQIKPNSVGVIGNLGLVLQSLGRLDEAEACFRQALQIKPEQASLYSNLLYFLLLSATMDVKSVFSEHARFGEQFESALSLDWPEHTHTRDPERCLQIGLVSPDFNNHAVATFIEPVLEHLSSYPQLSLHAYYNSVINDKVTHRLRGHFAHWYPVTGLSDAELAEKIRADGIDILIDLTGHTARNRLLTFARKPAPVQASWMGYPGTTGLKSMDYFLADRFFLPPGQFDGQFTERIVYLPAGAPFLPSKDAPPVNGLPALSNGYLTFGSFSRPNKLSPAVISLWAELLRALPDSRMLLGGMPEEGNYDALIKWFEMEGIGCERLIFHARCGMENYLNLHQQVDYCLDTFPYNGGTTTLHALWMGVPTLTLAGDTAAGRSGASILGHAGLESFIARDAADFLNKGLSWAGNLAALSDIRSGLRERFTKSAMGQPVLVATGVERALRMMWQRWCAGLPAESFEVPLQAVNSTVSEVDS